MRTTLLTGLIDDVATDFSRPGVVWQIAEVAGCALLGWLLARALRRVFSNAPMQPAGLQLVGERFSRILTPFLTWLLLLAARPLLAPWHHVNLVRLALLLAGALALIRFAFYALQRAFGRKGTAGGLLKILETVFALLVCAGVALYITGWWPDLVDYLEHTVVPIGHHEVSVLTILQAAGSVIVTLVVALWAGRTLEDRLMRIEDIHSSLRAVIARLARALLIVVAVLVSLSMVGIDLTVLSVFGGALGVGLGLGLQKVASNYVSGFIILLERSLAIGDMIMVDRYSGIITRINARYTVLRALDGVETVVPNEMLAANAVQNLSLSDRSLRLATTLAVAYDTDIERLFPLLVETAMGVSRVMREPAPSANLLRFGADGLELEVGFWIADPENGRMGVTSEVNRAIWRLLNRENVTVPYPQREVTLLRRARPPGPPESPDAAAPRG
ncbi:MAG: mechanosensitive ion channel family protein [Burkholderiaceae bacterium]